jgi:hypothetical protein
MEVLVREASLLLSVLDHFVSGNVLTAQGTAFSGAIADIVELTVQFLANFSTNILV